jgi:hypothetical protein
MSLASDSRKHAQQWFDLAKHLPAEVRQAAREIAESWFQLAMDADVIEQDQKSTDAPTSNALH